jgi:two-component system sensor histidine kinase KdpD
MHTNLQQTFPAGLRSQFRRISPRERNWLAYLAGAATAAVPTIAGFLIGRPATATNLAILYTLAVVLSALQWGRLAAIVSAVCSAVLLNWFFVPPFRSLLWSDIWDSITLAGFLAIGLIVSTLAVSAQEEAREARRRAVYIEALYSFTRSLVEAEDFSATLAAIERHFRETFSRPILIAVPGKEGLETLIAGSGFRFDEEDRHAAMWSLRNGERAGHETENWPSAKAFYLPLKTNKGTIGVLGLWNHGLQVALSPDRRELFGAFADQAALAISRALLAEEARRAELLQETGKLQTALLNSISHNLRTPLASVSGALNTLIEDGELLDAATKRELLDTAQEEARRLNGLVQNLLDMTRLEGGAVCVKREPCHVQDVIGAALAQLGEPARRRQVDVTLPPDPPLVTMDFVLIVQVLVNLLDNAFKYSPADTPVTVAARMDSGYLEVTVTDVGQGIAKEDEERVFEKFFRAPAAGRAGGAGLGLSICKGFIEAHGGRIWAKRLEPHGTEVGFALPTGGGNV